MLTIVERARRCVATRPPAIAGAGGHAATFGVACLLVHGFGLSPDEAMPLMEEYNATCSPPWNERDLRHKLTSALTATHKEPRGYMVQNDAEKGAASYTSATYETPKKRKREFDLEALKRVQRKDWKVGTKWLMDRSPVDPATVTDLQYLDALYNEGEKVLIFMSMRSMGEYGYVKGRGFYKLGKVPGEAPQRIDKLPDGSDQGMQFMMQPVDGKWHPVQGTTRMSRRTRTSVLRYPYMLLESDEAPHELWLNWLSQLKLPIVSITHSAGRSMHVLIKLGTDSREEWEECADMLMPMLTAAGCDSQAMHPIVYPRMPNKMRRGKGFKDKFEPFTNGARKQRLLYFNPSGVSQSIGLREVRA